MAPSASMTTPVLYGMPPGLSSMMEKHPQMLLSTHALRNAAISGPSSEHMIAGFVSIDRPWREYSGNTTRSIVGKFRRALATKSTIHWVCTARSVGVTTLGSWSCTTPKTTPFGDLFRPPRPPVDMMQQLSKQLSSTLTRSYCA
mmetsp:Transcript_6374/g.20012  ORF Transcript_6374/g.20012 Transcript_6374/m.20012 type:complete len:144 (+) Transcript_6374:708-1139(+)